MANNTWAVRARGLAGQLVAWVALAASPAMAGTDVAVDVFGSGDFLAAQTWRPVDFHMYSSTTDFASLFQILPEPHHVAHPDLGVGPGAAHDGPYDTEVGDGVLAAGIDEKQVFTVEEFTGDGLAGTGNGVFLAFMVVADPKNAPVGLTPDGLQPMIPNTLFGLQYNAEVYRNGVKFDAFGFSVPPLDGELDPPFDVDGHSHFPLFAEEDSSFVPAGTPLTGDYEFRITLTDTQGNGYTIVSGWTVTAVPEPATATLMALALLGLTGVMRGRRSPG